MQTGNVGKHVQVHRLGEQWTADRPGARGSEPKAGSLVEEGAVRPAAGSCDTCAQPPCHRT